MATSSRGDVGLDHVDGLPPGRLVLEITESLLVSDDDSVWKDLERLWQSGVRIAIDDFGTGYSALGYLRHTPLDIVKLDRVFISTTEAATSRWQVPRVLRLTDERGCLGGDTPSMLVAIRRSEKIHH